MRKTLHLYLLREILAPFLAALLFLTQLFIVMRLLAQADVIFGSGVSPSDVGKVLLYLLPSMLSYGMPVAFLLGILVGLGRLSDDRELTALAATGHGPHLLLPTPLALGGVLTAAMLAVTAWLEPLGLASARALMNAVIKRNLAGDVKPGVFYEDLSDLTLYAGKVSPTNGRLRDVLVHDERDPSAPLLVLAERGSIDTEGPAGAIVLRLEDGELHRAVQKGDDYALARFEAAEVSVVVEAEISRKNKMRRPLETSSAGEIWEHVRALKAQGRAHVEPLIEFHRRLAHPFVMLAFALVGVAAAGTSVGGRRGGRAIAYGWTLGAVVAYFVLGKLFGALGSRQVFPPWLAAWSPALLLAALAAAFFLFRRARGGAT